MLVIANGAFKSGSSWQHRILKSMVPCGDLPPDFQDPKWANSSIDRTRLREFLSLELHNEQDFVVKNHFSRPAEFVLLKDCPNVFVFDIHRDIRDVIVSAFYHYKNIRSFSGTFPEFFERRARDIVMAVIRHNDMWDRGGSNIFSGNYEDLHADFEREVRRMGAFIGRDVSNAEIANIKEATSFSKMASRGSPFFRKGKVGDWKNHLDRYQLRALSEWVSQARTEQQALAQRRETPRHRGCQTIFSRSGEIAFTGEWDSRALLTAISHEGSGYWRGKRVLDIGANTSGLSIEIARSGAEVVAIDPDPYSNTIALARGVVERIIREENLQIALHRAELFDAHNFGKFDAVLCLGLIYHFRYPQYVVDYLSTLEVHHLFISTQTHPGSDLALVNRRDPSVLRPDFLSDDIVLTGWHPTRPLFERMLGWAGFGEITPLTDQSINFPQKPPGLTNSAYYRATKVHSTKPHVAKRQFYPR
jgi:2-polyprenyl-3-methyl-5-hydroxy-6-metoxy-1,4-benzoquinol methylase